MVGNFLVVRMTWERRHYSRLVGEGEDAKCHLISMLVSP